MIGSKVVPLLEGNLGENQLLPAQLTPYYDRKRETSGNFPLREMGHKYTRKLASLVLLVMEQIIKLHYTANIVTSRW